jgi:hypothetical protein
MSQNFTGRSHDVFRIMFHEPRLKEGNHHPVLALPQLSFARQEALSKDGTSDLVQTK